MSATPTFPRGNALSQFIHNAPTMTIPDAVWHEAKRALIDYLGVSIGATGDDAASAVQRVAQRWQARGRHKSFSVRKPHRHWQH